MHKDRMPSYCNKLINNCNKQNRDCSRHKARQELKQPKIRNFSKLMNSCTTYDNKCKKHSKTIGDRFLVPGGNRGREGQVPRPGCPGDIKDGFLVPFARISRRDKNR